MPSNIKKIIFILIPIVLFLFLWQIFQPTAPKFLSATPADQSQNISTGTEIVFLFEKPLKNQKFSVSVNPEFTLTTGIQNNQFIVTPQELLKYETQYTVVLKSSSQREFTKITFKTISPQGSTEFLEEIQKEQGSDYPLAPYSPPDNAHFYFLYEGPRKIKVFSSLNQASTQKEFFDWVASLKIDLSDHQINWQVQP